MGEVAKRTEEEQIEVEDGVLALSESGWSHRAIADELSISRKSIPTYRERALNRIAIPEHDTAVRENIVELRFVMDECRRRLSDPKLPNTATNVPNLLHQYTRARAELNKVLEVGNKQKITHGFDQTLAEIVPQLFTDDDSHGRRRWERVDEAETLEEVEPGVYGVPDEEGDA